MDNEQFLKLNIILESLSTNRLLVLIIMLLITERKERKKLLSEIIK